ncbi:MAG: LuxR C-terminal-related transcriptional regulator [Acidimicrobiia bacterium]
MIWSPEIFPILGIDATDDVSRPFAALSAMCERVEDLRTIAEHVLRTGRRFEGTQSIVVSDGTAKLLRGVIVPDEDDPNAVRGMLYDLTAVGGAAASTWPTDRVVGEILQRTPTLLAAFGPGLELRFASRAAFDVVAQLPGGDLTRIKVIDRNGQPRAADYPDSKALERIVADPVCGVEMADGSTRWYNVTIDLAMADVDGSIIATAHDITQQVNLERELRSANGSLARLLSAVDAAITARRVVTWTYDIAGEVITGITEQDGRLLSMAADTSAPFHPREFWSQVHPDDLDRLCGITDRICEVDHDDVVYRFVRMDGSITLHRQIARAVRDESGTMTHILGSTAELGPVGGSDGEMTATLATEALDPEMLDALKQLEGRLGVIANEAEFTAGNMAARAVANAPFEMTSFPGVERLSEREREIFTLLADGLRPVTIARRVFLSPSTIRNHLSSIYKKLGVSSQIELMTRLVEFRATGRHS